jgi:hypothetical protein
MRRAAVMSKEIERCIDVLKYIKANYKPGMSIKDLRTEATIKVAEKEGIDRSTVHGHYFHVFDDATKNFDSFIESWLILRSKLVEKANDSRDEKLIDALL